MRIDRLLMCGAIAAAAQACASSALAWGDEGHEVVGLIAEHYLKPDVKQKVDALLAGDTTNLVPHDTSDPIADEATWADKYRDQDGRKLHYATTQQWHFVDQEIGHPDLTSACFGRPSLPAQTVASQGPAQDCIVDKIEQFQKELADPATRADERRMALQFLLHFIGDLHQPLHSSDDNDRGGNSKTVSAHGLTKGKLHAYWDTQFVQALGPDPTTIAASLIKKITTSERSGWSNGTPDDWAKESFGVAQSTAYGKLPAPNPDRSYTLSAAYIASAKDVVSLQLQRAGVRLAAILNNSL